MYLCVPSFGNTYHLSFFLIGLFLWNTQISRTFTMNNKNWIIFLKKFWTEMIKFGRLWVWRSYFFCSFCQLSKKELESNPNKDWEEVLGGSLPISLCVGHLCGTFLVLRPKTSIKGMQILLSHLILQFKSQEQPYRKD